MKNTGTKEKLVFKVEKTKNYGEISNKEHICDAILSLTKPDFKGLSSFLKVVFFL